MKYELIKTEGPKGTWYYVVIDEEKKLAYMRLEDAEEVFDILTSKKETTTTIIKSITI